MKDCIFEILTEELPSKLLSSLSRALSDAVSKRLSEASVAFQCIEAFATPRRLALVIRDLAEKSADKKTVRKGLFLSQAIDELGHPTKAGLGFAKSCGVSFDRLEKMEIPEGVRLCYSEILAGKSIRELLPEILNQALKQLPIAKSMRWGEGEIEFIRPVHRVILLYGKEIIPAKILGKIASNQTEGHRFLSSEIITIRAASEYEEKLLSHHVIASFEKRREKIRQQVMALAKEKGGEAHMPAALLDEVTGLVEYPVALCGSFEESFLALPKEVLVISMQQHQRYFPLQTAEGKLLPHFIFISNLVSKSPEIIIAGNERVIRSRLKDALFFYNTEFKQQKSLDTQVDKLKQVVYQAGLGTLFDKTERLQKLVNFLVDPKKELGKEELRRDAERAAYLSKADLMTLMVGEFPELQGVMGKYYALAQKEVPAVALALQEQYLPRYAGEQVPSSFLGQVLALADRMDLLIGIFGIGKKPTGEKDPFGLRRAALGIIRIIVECAWSIDLSKFATEAQAAYYPLKITTVLESPLQFIQERFKHWVIEHKGFESEDVESVLYISHDYYDIYLRLIAIKKFKELPESESLMEANKRVKNLLKSQDNNKFEGNVNDKLLKEDAEKQLWKEILVKQQIAKDYVSRKKYFEYLEQLATLKTFVDNFLDKILVIAEDQDLRINRLILLRELQSLFLIIADFT